MGSEYQFSYHHFNCVSIESCHTSLGSMDWILNTLTCYFFGSWFVNCNPLLEKLNSSDKYDALTKIVKKYRKWIDDGLLSTLLISKENHSPPSIMRKTPNWGLKYEYFNTNGPNQRWIRMFTQSKSIKWLVSNDLACQDSMSVSRRCWVIFVSTGCTPFIF